MKKYIYLLYGILLISYHISTAQITNTDTVLISIDEAWQKAYNNSKELKEQDLKTAIGEENIKDAKMQILPHVGVEAQYGKLANIPIFVDGITNVPEYVPLTDHSIYHVNAEAYFNIYSGGATKTAIKTAEAKQALLEHIKEETTDQLHLEVIQHYLDLQRFFKFKDLIKHNIKQSEERLRLITELHKNGVVLKSDLLRAQLQLSKQQTQLVTMDNNIVLATQSLNILMGNDDDIPLMPADSIELKNISVSKDYYSYVDASFTHSPLEKMAETEITLSELNSAALKADKKPKIGLFGTYSYSYPQIMLYPYEMSPYLLGMAGVRLTYDISALYHDKHKERAAEIAIEHQRVAKENVEDAIRKKIKTAYKRFEEDLQKVEVSKNNIEQAQENYRIVDQTYFNQLALLTDLLDADNQLLQARFELIDNQIAAKLHYYQLIKTSGEL
ncbi:MAG: outer membrane component of tripartite multidrug resistance system [Thalassobius sp.]|nr:outer membrane component of tripartite multidrug resistance system [Thalassovita sp.]